MTQEKTEMESTLAEVIRFIEQEVPHPRPGQITAQTDLRHNLRLLPEDADNLMGKFAKQFGVSSGDFELIRYFPQEDGFVIALYKGLSRKGRKDNNSETPRLTVGMLAGAARDGTWRSDDLEREFGGINSSYRKPIV